jgi:hypothetical protein
VAFIRNENTLLLLKRTTNQFIFNVLPKPGMNAILIPWYNSSIINKKGAPRAITGATPCHTLILFAVNYRAISIEAKEPQTANRKPETITPVPLWQFCCNHP